MRRWQFSNAGRTLQKQTGLILVDTKYEFGVAMTVL